MKLGIYDIFGITEYFRYFLLKVTKSILKIRKNIKKNSKNVFKFFFQKFFENAFFGNSCKNVVPKMLNNTKNNRNTVQYY